MKNALKLWEIVKLAHSKENEAVDAKIIGEFGDPDAGDRCILYDTDIGVVVVFLGSDDKLDWLRNLALYPALSGRVIGFELGYRKISDAIIKRLRDAHPDIDIYITGYSRGGPLAMYLTEDLRDIGFSIRVECMTCESPNAYYYFPTAGMRITNFEVEGDIVPDFPIGASNPGVTIKIGELRWWKRLYRAYRLFRVSKKDAGTVEGLKAVVGLVGDYHQAETFDRAIKEWEAKQSVGDDVLDLLR